MSKKYTDWSNAGGPDECEHGYAKGIPCPKCDYEQGNSKGIGDGAAIGRSVQQQILTLPDELRPHYIRALMKEIAQWVDPMWKDKDDDWRNAITKRFKSRGKP